MMVDVSLICARRDSGRVFRSVVLPLAACLAHVIMSPLAQATEAAEPTTSPNIIFFLVDDLGWADLGCYGSAFHETPHIDALADSGVRFTQAYAACPVCSPTRASILTGRHPVRVGITDWLPGMRTPAGSKFQHVSDRDNLALEEVTLAEVLRQQGYQTYFAGKWHLGDQGHWPEDQGFDVNIGGCSKGSPPGGYYSPWNNPRLKSSSKREYLTERLTTESIRLMQQRDKSKPFLLYLSYYNVHTPITPYEKRLESYVEKAASRFATPTPTIPERSGISRGRQDNAEYASMVAAVDDSVGSVLGALKKLGIENNTIVCFFSDNGGLCTKSKMAPACNLPLRSGKGWLYEGGIREPMLMRVPGAAKAGDVCDVPVFSTDFFPTLLRLANIPEQPMLHRDGQSLDGLLRGESKLEPRTLYWHYPHYHGSTWTPGAAIRDGDWKLIEFYEHDKVELYNLRDDVGERNDLAATNPKQVLRLRRKLETWQQAMGAQMPRPRK